LAVKHKSQTETVDLNETTHKKLLNWYGIFPYTSLIRKLKF